MCHLVFAAAVFGFVSCLIWSQRSHVAHWVFVRLEQRFPPWRNNSNQPIAGIIALGGSFNGLSSPGERFEAAVRLGTIFPDARVVFSGREETAGGADGRAAFIADGIEPSRIAVEERSANTAENAAFSARLLQPKAEERWILVTSAFHMPRAIGAFRKAGFAVEAYPVEYFSIDGGTDSRKAAKEIIGLIYYRVIGQSDCLYPGP
jgi:uncharacterized SAM-binding protein YcdF (DUF218 family)